MGRTDDDGSVFAPFFAGAATEPSKGIDPYLMKFLHRRRCFGRGSAPLARIGIGSCGAIDVVDRDGGIGGQISCKVPT